MSYKTKAHQQAHYRRQSKWLGIRRVYGLSQGEWRALWIKQGGVCGICAKPMLSMGTKANSVCIDHDHQTNRVRGLLCRSCNTLLGLLEGKPWFRYKAQGWVGHEL